MCSGGGGGGSQEPIRYQDPRMPEQSAQGTSGASTDARRRALQTGGPAASTLLTGPSGVENSSLNIGRSTLLGA